MNTLPRTACTAWTSRRGGERNQNNNNTTSKTLLSPRVMLAHALHWKVQLMTMPVSKERIQTDAGVTRTEAQKIAVQKGDFFMRFIFMDRRSLQCRNSRFRNPFGFGMRRSCAATPEYVAVQISALNSFCRKSYAVFRLYWRRV